MNKKQVLEALGKLREVNEKRKFSQTVDLVINLRGIDIKKPEQKHLLRTIKKQGGIKK